LFLFLFLFLFCFGLFVFYFVFILFCFFNAHNSALTTCSVTRRAVTVVTPVWQVLRSAPPIHLFAAALNIVKRGVKHPYPNLTQSSESITAWGRGSRGQGRHGATFKSGGRVYVFVYITCRMEIKFYLLNILMCRKWSHYVPYLVITIPPE
jgi:hypothetical protein